MISKFLPASTGRPTGANFTVKRLAVIVFIITIPLFFIILFFNLSVSSPLESYEAERSTLADPNAYFTPPPVESLRRVVSGRISHIQGVISKSEVKHKLVDANGQKIAYIYSEVNDLNLSVGLDVEIHGEATGERYNGVEIINVKSIKLK